MTTFSLKKKKIAKYPIYGPFCSNLGKNEFSPYIGLRYFLAPYSPLASYKKSEKLLTNGQTNARTNKHTNKLTQMNFGEASRSKNQ